MPGTLGQTPASQSIAYEGEGGGAPTTATYVVGSANGSLSEELVITGNTWIVGDTSVAAQVQFNIVSGSIGTTQIENLSVATGKIAADAVTYAKLQNASAASIVLGRSTAGSGDFEEVGFTGDVTLAGNILTIGNSKVTLAKMANLSGSTRFIGRFTPAAGIPEDLSGASATQMLSQFTSTAQGVVAGSGGGTSNFLRADGSWAAPPSGGGPTVVINTTLQQHRAAAGVSFVNGMSFAITSGVTYYYEYNILFGTSVATTGLRLGLSYGAVNYGAAQVYIPVAANGVASELQGQIAATGTSVTGTGVAVANTRYLASMIGIINPSTTTTLNLMFGSEIAATTVSVHIGSMGRLYTVSA